ncbi:EamA family transporter [Kutzneria albida]|uniref:Integral membrane protein n=1 Tax=Kutzneria albida DSM 43870 TaxID=1449976 RepID=W5W6R5_9PSEU|nr:EamA family transporter [Kutzneria albida]AHH96455.1 integral membrane protein [Kutzneria albida DSM 43870]
MKPAHLLLAVSVAAAWGINFVAIDYGLDSFPPLLFTALRFAVAAVPAVLFVGRPQVAWRWVVAVGLVLGALQFGLLFVAIKAGVPAGLSSLVLQSQALFTALFSAVLLGERPTRGQLLGMGVALAGIVLVATDFGASGPLPAFLLVLASAASWAMGNVLTRKAAPPDSFRFLVWVSVVPPLPLLALSALTEDLSALHAPEPSSLVALGYVAWVSTVFGFGVWTTLIRRYGATAVAPYSLLVPVFGMSSTALVLGEQLTVLRVVGAGVVLVGVGLTALTGRRRTPPGRQDSSRLVEVS